MVGPLVSEVLGLALGERAGFGAAAAPARVAPTGLLVGLPRAGVGEVFLPGARDRTLPGGRHPGLIDQLEIEREVVPYAAGAVFAGRGVVAGARARGRGTGGEGAAGRVTPGGLAAGLGGGPAVDNPEALAIDGRQRRVRIRELFGDVFVLGARDRVGFAVGAAVGFATAAVEGPVAIAAGLTTAGGPVPIALGVQRGIARIVVVERLVAALGDRAALAVGGGVRAVGREGAVAIAVIGPDAEARMDPHAGGGRVGGGVRVGHVVFGELGERAGDGAEPHVVPVVAAGRVEPVGHAAAADTAAGGVQGPGALVVEDIAQGVEVQIAVGSVFADGDGYLPLLARHAHGAAASVVEIALASGGGRGGAGLAPLAVGISGGSGEHVGGHMLAGHQAERAADGAVA